MTDDLSAERPAGRSLSRLKATDVAELKKVGPKKKQALAEMGIENVLDLLTHYPRKYADRSHAIAIADLEPGDEGAISATVRQVRHFRPRGRPAIVTVIVDDETGTLTVTFFNQEWRARQLSPGMGVVIYGKADVFRGSVQVVNPIVDLVGDQTGRIVPIYPQSGKAGIASNELGHFVTEALERAKEFADPVDDATRRQLSLISRTDAFRSIHAPPEYADIEVARRRLAFDELFRLQVSLVQRRRAAEADARGIVHPVVKSLATGLVRTFLGALPFSLTGAQERVVRELADDLAAPLPMHRLLQGDVGSGKTVVAIAAMLFAVDGGRQGALMVPTEVLAEQHYLLAKQLLGGLRIPDPDRLEGDRPIEVALLTSRTPVARRRRVIAGLKGGQVDLAIGTHALLTEGVNFRALGVVVIDEQHRFGVDQRAALREKGSSDEAGAVDPDVLVMTATPIPRTAAMTVYGDLDQSVIDELPAGRAPIKTVVLAEEDEDAAWSAVLGEVGAGRQAFVICPLVRPGAAEPDESDGGGDEAGETLFAADDRPRRPSKSAEEEFARLTEGPLAGVRVGILHGQLPPKEKEVAMDRFRRGDLDVIVATTVIEVGVDVPNATVIVIEDADRFGIAQLHQLRGRVGRGSHPATCFLVADRPSVDGELRLEALRSSTDGFRLAEIDRELRGAGTVLGTRQKGRQTDLKLANFRDHGDLIEPARRVATEIIDADPRLEEHVLLRNEVTDLLGDSEEYLHRS